MNLFLSHIYGEEICLYLNFPYIHTRGYVAFSLYVYVYIIHVYIMYIVYACSAVKLNKWWCPTSVVMVSFINIWYLYGRFRILWLIMQCKPNSFRCSKTASNVYFALFIYYRYTIELIYLESCIITLFQLFLNEGYTANTWR